MEYLCTACGVKVNADMMVYREHVNKHVIDLIKNDHPGWVEQDGICKKCVEYYESELKGSTFHDAACVRRQRTIKAIFAKISSIIKSVKKV